MRTFKLLLLLLISITFVSCYGDGIEKLKTAFVAVPEFVTVAFAPEASDVTVPTDTAAAVPAGPCGPVAPVGPGRDPATTTHSVPL